MWKAVDQMGVVWLIAFVMKTSNFFLLSGASCVLVSCGAFKNVNQPLGDSSFDPLNGPGKSQSSARTVKVTGPTYKPGQWVETAMPNSTFFRVMPQGNATADKVLKAGTPLKVIKVRSSYVKVELDSGDVGYVPSIMVAERAPQGTGTSFQRSPNEVPIIPGVPFNGSVDDLPPLPEDPGLPSDSSPPPIDSGNFSPPSVPSVPPVETAPLPDLPPPPEVPGITEPKPVE